MSLSTPFIHRPVGTTLLTVAIMLAGALSYGLLRSFGFRRKPACSRPFRFHCAQFYAHPRSLHRSR